MNKLAKIYNDDDPRDLPAYPVTAAARYLGLPYHTLYSWLRPVSFTTEKGYASRALIERPKDTQHFSFFNLVEGHIIKALIRAHSVPLGEIRHAIEYCEKECEIDRLLVSGLLEVGISSLFVEQFGYLINVGKGSQLALKKMLERYLERIEYKDHLPVRLIPFVLDREEKLISISPYVAFGKPVLSHVGITTEVIAQRFELGEKKKTLAEDYGIGEAEVEEAIIYESAA